MKNKLINSHELSILKSTRLRLYGYLNRKISHLFRILRLENIRFLVEKRFLVCFIEERTIPIRLPKNNYFSRSLTLFDQREVLHRALVAHAIKNNYIDSMRNIIDAGSQNGDCALAWASLIEGQVYAIDPSIKNLNFIKEVKKINSIKNIKTINYALSNDVGYLYPIYNINHTPFSKVSINRFTQRNKVEAITLDKLYQKGIISNIGYMHLDVEGMELDVLRGSVLMITDCSPVISFESHITIDDINSIINLLKYLNYSIYMINEATLGGRPDCVNFMALPKEFNLDVIVNSMNAVIPVQEFYKTTIGPNLIKLS